MTKDFQNETGSGQKELTAILFVEDDENDFILAHLELRRLNVSSPVIRVATPDEMMEYLHGEGKYADRAQYPMPAVIFLDMRLPGQNGLLAQARLRSSIKFRSIPIVSISGTERITMLRASVELGANAYMTKPFNRFEFGRIILEQKLPVRFTPSATANARLV